MSGNLAVLPPLELPPVQRRESEEHARWAVDADVRGRGVPITWTGARDDPPDAWAEIAGRRYAVEVSSIDGTNAIGQPGMAAQALQKQAIRPVLHELESDGTVVGEWLLWSRPLRDVRGTRRFLSARLREFFVSGEHSAASRLDLFGPAHYRAELTRWHGDGDSIGLMVDSGGGAGGHHIDDELRRLLREVVDTKIRKMDARGVRKPWALAVIDRYAWRREKWTRYLPESADAFDAVYRVDGGRPAALVRCAPGYAAGPVASPEQAFPAPRQPL